MRDGCRLAFDAFDKPDAPKALDAEGFTQEEVDAAIRRMDERNQERGRL